MKEALEFLAVVFLYGFASLGIVGFALIDIAFIRIVIDVLTGKTKPRKND